MDLLPLVLSAGGWTQSGTPDARQNSLPERAPCRFCGFHAEHWMEPCDDGRGHPIPACLHCHLCRHLDRPTIETEASLVWMPEVSHAALIAIVRRLHVICARHEASPAMDSIPRAREPALLQAWGLHAALLQRISAAERRLGSASISDLCAAFAGMTDITAPARASLLGGLRLLPRGRFFRGGRDVYPALLAGISKSSGAAA
ncbi:MAG: hypothetical protein NVSMB18_37410 [Acetobacteraceae bacterium]